MPALPPRRTSRPPPWKATAISWRRNACSRVRRTAPWALGALGDPDGADALRTVLTDSDATVRRHAAWALTRLPEPV
jgi:HEAT repeat protein